PANCHGRSRQPGPWAFAPGTEAFAGDGPSDAKPKGNAGRLPGKISGQSGLSLDAELPASRAVAENARGPRKYGIAAAKGRRGSQKRNRSDCCSQQVVVWPVECFWG